MLSTIEPLDACATTRLVAVLVAQEEEQSVVRVKHRTVGRADRKLVIRSSPTATCGIWWASFSSWWYTKVMGRRRCHRQLPPFRTPPCMCNHVPMIGTTTVPVGPSSICVSLTPQVADCDGVLRERPAALETSLAVGHRTRRYPGP